MNKAELIAKILEAPAERMPAIVAALQAVPHRRRPIQPKEAAEILGVCRRSLTRYERAGRLTRIQVSPRKIRYDLNEVEALAFGESREA